MSLASSVGRNFQWIKTRRVSGVCAPWSAVVFVGCGLVSVSCSISGAISIADPVEEFEVLRQSIQRDICPSYFEALQFPDGDAARKLLDGIHLLAGKLAELPEPPAIHPVIGADKHRLLAFLWLAKAGVLGALKDNNLSAPGTNPDLDRSRLADEAIRHFDTATNWLAAVKNPDSKWLTPALNQAIHDSEIEAHLYSIKCTAHSILWLIRGVSSDREAARVAWEAVPSDYRQRHFAPAPDVIKTLGLMVPSEKSMTTISWAGIILVFLGVLLALAFPKMSIFQQWAIRVLIAMGCAMAATVIPGLLNIDIPRYIAAGGALAVIVLIYCFNPPRLPPDLGDSGHSEDSASASPKTSKFDKKVRRNPYKPV